MTMVCVRLYRVRGVVKLGEYWSKFSIDIPATKAYEAVERAYSQLGSWYGVKRSQIEVKAVEEIDWGKAKRPELNYLRVIDRVLVH